MTLLPRKSHRRLTVGALLGVVSVTALTGCIGNDGGGDGGDDGASDCAPSDEAMETAKTTLDDTSGIDIKLATDDSPSGIAIIESDATVVRPESFEATFTGQAFGQQAPGEAVGIGDDYWIKVEGLPGYTDWTKVDPADFNVPALTLLLDPDTGLSNVLTNTDDLSDGRAERDENDTSKVLCYYEGTLTAETLQTVIPSANGDDFSVEYAVDGDGALRKATMTGDFYDDGEKITYVLDILEYDVEKDITAPR